MAEEGNGARIGYGESTGPVRVAKAADLKEVGRIPTLKGNPQRHIAQRVCRLASNGIRRTGNRCLVDGSIANQMQAAGARVAHVKNEITRQLRLDAKTIFLHYRRAEIWVEGLDGECSRR